MDPVDKLTSKSRGSCVTANTRKSTARRKRLHPSSIGVAEIYINRMLKLDRAEKQDEPAPEVDPSELPVEDPLEATLGPQAFGKAGARL